MPLVSLRRHYRLGLAVALGVALLGAVFALKKGKPLYSVTATIYIAPRFVNILREPKDFDVTSYQQFRQFVEHQIHTIGRYDIVLEALRKLGDRRWSWQAPDETERHAAERLMASLKIVAIKDTYLATVSLESPRAEHLEAIVNSVVDTYVETVQRETLFYNRDARLDSLRKQRGKLIEAVDRWKTRRNEIAQELGVTTFTDDAANPFDQILMDGRNALAEAHRQTIAAQASLDALAGKSEGSALNALAAETIAKDAGLNSLKANLNGRRARLLEQISGLDEAHPLRRRIERELGDIDAELGRAVSQLMQDTAQGLLEQRRSELRKAQQVERELEKHIESQRQKGAWFSSLYNEALGLNEELARTQRQVDEIDNRIEFFQLESQAPGYVRAESYARPPEYPIGGGRKKLLALALAAALILGAAVPIAVDLLDRRIRTPGQAAKLLGYPPMAAIFEPSDDLAVRRVDTDRKRRLAIALDRERRHQATRVFLFTSVRPEAGVTGLALELALHLAELGARTLVIETNPLKPDPRYQAQGSPGLEELLAGEAEGAAAVLPAAGKLPDRIGIGFSALPHLHNYPRLDSLLGEFKTRYDVILLDAPPVLLSADTEFLVGLADATLLLIGAGQVMPGDLRRAVGILHKIDPAAVGFIVTRLEIFRGGGYFAELLEAYGAADDAARQVLRSHPHARKPI